MAIQIKKNDFYIFNWGIGNQFFKLSMDIDTKKDGYEIRNQILTNQKLVSKVSAALLANFIKVPGPSDDADTLANIRKIMQDELK